jgi:hypothetical protein
MKIYVNGYECKKDLTYDTTFKRAVVYTTEGMYEQRKNKLWKIEFTNQRTEKVVHEDVEFLIDYTELSYSDTLLHIPFEHICCEETIQRKNLGSMVFVKRTYYDQTSCYFEVDGKLESFMFKEMFSFLL